MVLMNDRFNRVNDRISADAKAVKVSIHINPCLNITGL